MENKTVLIGDKMVQLFNIIGTNMWVADAWIKLESPIVTRNYRTITHNGKAWYGRIGSKINDNYELAYELIFKVFPELRDIPHKKNMGDITFIPTKGESDEN